MKMIQLTTNAIDELVGPKTRFPLQIGFPPVAISSAKALFSPRAGRLYVEGWLARPPRRGGRNGEELSLGGLRAVPALAAPAA
jgi:hypothetical protein